MKIIEEYPPNIKQIESALGKVVMNGGIVFTWGEILYNPSKLKIQDHLLMHEQVHQLQQEKMGIDNWWATYLYDPKFRLEQEIEAYAVQYKFVKSRYTVKSYEMFLDLIGNDLSSSMYGNIIGKHQAMTRIRKLTQGV
jgi:hypothetical protein